MSGNLKTPHKTDGERCRVRLCVCACDYWITTLCLIHSKIQHGYDKWITNQFRATKIQVCVFQLKRSKIDCKQIVQASIECYNRRCFWQRKQFFFVCLFIHRKRANARRVENVSQESGWHLQRIEQSSMCLLSMSSVVVKMLCGLCYFPFARERNPWQSRK